MLANLSQKARAEVSKLQGQIEALVSADIKREPHLNEVEKSEVEGWEREAKRLSTRLPELEEMLSVKTQRLDEINAHGVEMVVNGLDPNEISLEFATTRQAVELLRLAVNACYTDREMAVENIRKIKDHARAREVKDGR